MRLDRARLLEALERSADDTVYVWAWWEYDQDHFDWTEDHVPNISRWDQIQGDSVENIILHQYQSQGVFRSFRLNSLWVKDDGTYVADGETNRYSNDMKVIVWGPSREETVEFLNTGPERPEPPALPEGDLPSEASFEDEFEQSVAANLQHLPRVGFRKVATG